MSEDELGITDIPPHVAAIDARRAREMNRVTNEKLGEWSQRLSLVKARFLAGVTTRAIEELDKIQADIVRAMDGKQP